MVELYQCSYHHIHATHLGADKMEELMHTFVFVQRRQWSAVGNNPVKSRHLRFGFLLKEAAHV